VCCAWFFFAVFVPALYAQTVDSVAIRQVDSLLQVSRTLTDQSKYDQALEVSNLAEKTALDNLVARPVNGRVMK
jgi:hypothetical protein